MRLFSSAEKYTYSPAEMLAIFFYGSKGLHRPPCSPPERCNPCNKHFCFNIDRLSPKSRFVL